MAASTLAAARSAYRQRAILLAINFPARTMPSSAPGYPGSASLPANSKRSLDTLAAVDLGSNSFHLQIARVVDGQLYPLDSLKETIRLGAGVTAEKTIDAKTAERALAALRLFAERLGGLPKDAVRVVGTNALRVAKNANEFVARAEAALGHPIEIIAGREEARLIYLGVSHYLPPFGQNRLVIDIGGGSTEFIIGHRLRPKLLDSLYMGCVSYSSQFFADGIIDKRRFKDAQLAARKEIEQIRVAFLKEGWKQAIGSSGTARALANIIAENFPGTHNITRVGLQWLRDRALRAGNFSSLDIPGLKADRIPVLAGGLAIMLTIFEELDIDEMMVADTALRDGVLHDLLGRTRHFDVRAATIEQFVKRYQVDRAQAERVERMAMHLFAQQETGSDAERRFDAEQRLMWGCRLHETGIAIAQAAFHKHSAYIIANADMPGFSKREQQTLAALVLAQRGKLANVVPEFARGASFMAKVMCLRLSVLLSRSRRHLDPKFFSLDATTATHFVFRINNAWLSEHDLTDYELQQESAEWKSAGVVLEIAVAV